MGPAPSVCCWRAPRPGSAGARQRRGGCSGTRAGGATLRRGGGGVPGPAGAGGGRAATTRRLLGDSAEESDLPPGWGAFPWAGVGRERTTALKATFALSGLARVLATARAAADEAGVRLHLRGSGGAGVLYGAMD